jgi:hypothetical protein
MKVKISKFNRDKIDKEVEMAINNAIAITRGKKGYRYHNEFCRNMELHVMEGYNIYTTSIVLVDKRDGTAPAFYSNGSFWLNRYNDKVELI